MSGVKKIMNTLIHKFLILMLLCGFFTTCDMPLGMGAPVDIFAPSILILEPTLNKSFGIMVITDPIHLSGEWDDDNNVVRLSATVTDTRLNIEYKNVDFKYVIENNMTWYGSLFLPQVEEEKDMDFMIKIFAYDSFGNQGVDYVTIKINLVAPWVERAWIARHPDDTSGQIIYDQAAGLVVGKQNYSQNIFVNPNAYKNLLYNNIVNFQNESFTVKLRLDSDWTDVAASRLHIYNDKGELLTEDWGIVPNRHGKDVNNQATPRLPEWDITAEDMENYFKSAAKGGATYLEFEIWAWNDIEWNGDWETGEPKEHPSGYINYRKQKIGGTVWYPETDYPVFKIEKDPGTGHVIINVSDLLAISLFDDDGFKDVYARLVPKTDYQNAMGGKTDLQFHDDIKNNANVRNSIITSFGLEKIVMNSPNGTITLNEPGSNEPGEYSLVLFASDNTLSNSVWSVYPPLMVDVQDVDSPIIVIENPESENIFPVLNNGRKFSISGYTIDRTYTQYVQIAWIPVALNTPAKTLANAKAAFNTTMNSVYAFNDQPGDQPHIVGDFRIWKLRVGPAQNYNLNGEPYRTNSFSKVFDIVDDFTVNNKLENDTKLFYIHTESFSNKPEYKTFRLTGYREAPAISINYPIRDNMIHSKDESLSLKMTVTPVSIGNGTLGIKNGWDGIRIRDVTITGTQAASLDKNAQDNSFGTNITADNNTYTKTIERDKDNNANNAYFSEGSRKVYLFEAEDILGNVRQVERRVFMSSASSLMYINCTSADGTYGAGTELRFEAVFSLPLSVSGTSSYLKLFYDDPGNTQSGEEDIRANFLHASGTTVSFRYIIEDGIDAEKLFTAVDSIVLKDSDYSFTANGHTGPAIIELTEENQETGSLQGLGRRIGINSVKPKIERAAFTQTNVLYEGMSHTGSSYFNAGKTVTLELSMDKPVRISGTPEALLSWGTGTGYAQFSSTDDNNKVIKFTWEVPDNINVNRSQIRWGQGTSSTAALPWLRLTGNNAITDEFGNPVSLTTLPVGNNGDDLNGNSSNKRAYLITNTPLPNPANIGLFKNFSSNTHSNPITIPAGNEVIKSNSAVFLQNTRPNDYTLFWYSLSGGGNPARINPVQMNADITDADSANRNNPQYKPSKYALTAWYEDFAGNRSPDNSSVISIEINSRATELVTINCSLPDGRYNAGREVTMNLVFSRPVTASANASVVMILEGVSGDKAVNQIETLPQNFTAGVIGTTLSVTFIIPSNKYMTEIKAKSIEFTGMTDDFGNQLKNYTDTVTTENSTQRPLKREMAETHYNLHRPGIIFDSRGPKIIGWSPGAGADYNTRYTTGISDSVYTNGGVMPSGERTITLEFDKPVAAQAGKSIIIRPYGNWGVPSVLTNEEFNLLKNSSFVDLETAPVDLFNLKPSSQTAEYQQRLSWIDANGLPRSSYTVSQIFNAATATKETILTERHNYNYYTYTTRGLIETKNGLVRPDTSAKWVLAFRYDIFDGIDRLREVFNAAQWKWQVISASSAVITTENDRSVVKITIPEKLDDGRIWEVIIQEGAFRDLAGNETEALQAGKYRFWSGGTATPVIRVDRYSQGDNFHGLFDPDTNMLNSFGSANRPRIDTMVRIDCATPGASIYYDTIRTHFTPAAAGTTTTSSVVFTTTDAAYNTGASFFNHPYVNFTSTQNEYNKHNWVTTETGRPSTGVYETHGSNPGWANNWIGNIGGHMGVTNFRLADDAIDADGYWRSLLVPIYMDSNTANKTHDINLRNNNGTISWNELINKQSGALSSKRIYRQINSVGSVSTTNSFSAITTAQGRILGSGTGTIGNFFYIGDAYAAGGGSLSDRNAAGNTDSRLFSGRRDYVVAAAQKNMVNSGTNTAILGPALTQSAWDREGVFKTTVLHRNPTGRGTANATFPGTNNGTTRMYIQGFDLPLNSTIAGFPINESTVPFPVANNQWLDYFTRMPWRADGLEAAIILENGNTNARTQARTDNNYIWVSWDIISDWYHKGRIWGYTNANNATIHNASSLNRDDKNYGSILCTYGAVTYRFEQRFYSTPNLGTP